MRKSTGLRVVLLAVTIGLSGIWLQVDASAGTAQGASNEDAEGIIFDRQQIMKQLDEDTETLGEIVSGEQPREKLAATTQAIAKGAHDSVAAFSAQVPGGRSKADVWSRHGDFMLKLNAFARGADDLARMGAVDDLNGVTTQVVAALPCKECHDAYREPKKPKDAAPKP